MHLRDAEQPAPPPPRAAGPAPPKATSAIAARIDALLHGARADGVGHVGVDDGEDARAPPPPAAGLTSAGEALDHRARGRRRPAPWRRRGSSPGSSRPSTTFASVTVGSVPAAAIGRRARAPRPPICGPTRKAPPASTLRDRAAAGADGVDVDHRHQQREAGDPGVARRRPRRSAPSMTMPISALVPPMSKVIRLSRPASAPTQAPPSTPAAGPDSRSATGCSATIFGRGDAAVRAP